MSYCRQEGKDKIIFVTKEDHETPSSAELVADDPNDPYEEHASEVRVWQASIRSRPAAIPLNTSVKTVLLHGIFESSNVLHVRQSGFRAKHGTESSQLDFQPQVLNIFNPGLILPNGDINWNCPCLGGMASGPCGEQFKSAFSCFHYSTEDVKGADCIEQFRGMQECMQKYPDLYPQEDDDDEPESQRQEEEQPPPAVDSTTTKEEGTS